MILSLFIPTIINYFFYYQNNNYTFLSFRQVNLKVSSQLKDCFNWSMVPQNELVVFARVSDPAVDLETTPPDGPWLEATAAAIPWSLGVDIAIWNAVGMYIYYIFYRYLFLHFVE